MHSRDNTSVPTLGQISALINLIKDLCPTKHQLEKLLGCGYIIKMIFLCDVDRIDREMLGRSLGFTGIPSYAIEAYGKIIHQICKQESIGLSHNKSKNLAMQIITENRVMIAQDPIIYLNDQILYEWLLIKAKHLLPDQVS